MKNKILFIFSFIISTHILSQVDPEQNFNVDIGGALRFNYVNSSWKRRSENSRWRFWL